jgi:hypothetical protein
MTTTELKNRIGTAAAVVTFTKKNGEKRVMKCAINKGYLLANATETDYVEPTGAASFDAESYGMVRVWDLENKGWRTITADTVEVVEVQ